MLVIKDLSIQFQKVLFDHASVEFKLGQLISIKGESGSGKSSFLKFIMNEIKSTGELYYNDVKINDENRESFLFNHVSYIDQIGSYYPNMTIKDHFEFYAKLHSMSLTDNDIYECFEKVHLTCKELKKSPSRLSTGERKRFLIALAIFLHKDILILDEPTASLDQESYDKLIKTLGELKRVGITILMTTHDLNLLEISDSIYEIKNCQIIKLKDNDNVLKRKQVHDRKPNHIKYRKYKNGKLRILFGIVFLIGCLVFGMISKSFAMMMSISQVQSQEVETYQNNTLYFMKGLNLKEINVTNLIDGAYTSYYLDVLNNEDIHFVEGIKGVTQVKPLEMLRKYGQQTSIEIFQNDKKVKDVVTEIYDDMFQKSFGCDLYVIGYYPEDNIQKEGKPIQGIYINDVLNNILEMDTLENISLKMNLIYVTGYTTDYNEDYGGNIIVTDSQKKDMTIPIDGVLSQNEYNDGFSYNSAKIYVPIDKLQEMIVNNFEELNTQYRQYLVYCEDGEDENVKIEIEEKNDLFVARNNRLSQQDFVEYVEQQSDNSRLTTIVISIILFIGMFLMIVYYFMLRKKEALYMKREGLQKNIKKYFNEDILMMLCCWIIVSIFMLWIYQRSFLILDVSKTLFNGVWMVSTLIVALVVYILIQIVLTRIIGSVMKNDSFKED